MSKILSNPIRCELNPLRNPLIMNWKSDNQEFLTSCQSLEPSLSMFVAWCLLLDASSLLVVGCLMLENLPDPSAKGGGLRPPPPLRNPSWMGLAGVRASSSEQQASIRCQPASSEFQASKIKNCALDSGTK